MTDSDKDIEMLELRGEVSRLRGKVDFLTGKVASLEQGAVFLELGWSRLDIDLHTPSFLLSRHKEEKE